MGRLMKFLLGSWKKSKPPAPGANLEVPRRPAVKRALLIGSRTGNLEAVLNDMNAMQAILQQYGFKITRCEESQATREAILAALQDLINSTFDCDSVVIYYTGHGGVTEKAGTVRSDKEPWRLQYLVPFDIDKTRKGSFRGILDIELSYYLQELTNVCHNVTVILDCCHSNRMARGSHVDRHETVKALKPAYSDIAFSHLRSIQSGGQLRAVNPFPEGNEHAVRISAAAALEFAFEFTDENGWRISALTKVLVRILADALHRDISWQSVSLRLQNQMALTMAKQHPEIAGPVARLLFSLEERPLSMHLVRLHSSRPPMLQAGRLHGVEENDVYALLPYGIERLVKSKKIATATVTRVTTTESELSLDKAYGFNQEVVAFLEQKALKHLPVSINGIPAFRDLMEAYIRISSPGVRVADQDEEHLASVDYDGQTISIHDEASVQVGQWPYRLDEGINASVSEMNKKLNTLGSIANLVRMESGADALNADLELQFGVVEHGTQRVIEGQTPVLQEGEKIFFCVRNNSSIPVHVHLFEACAGELALQSRLIKTGREIMGNGGHHTWGWNKEGQLTGWELPWPDHVGSETTYLDDTFIVIVTDTPIDLSCLDLQRLHSQGGVRGIEASAVLNNLRHFGFGYDKFRLAKSSEPSQGPRYDIHHIHLKLKKTN